MDSHTHPQGLSPKTNGFKSYALVAGAVALVPAAQAGTVTVPVNETVGPSTGSYDLTTNNGPDLTFSYTNGILIAPYVDLDVVGAANGSYAEDGSGAPLASKPGDTISAANSFGVAQEVLAGCKYNFGCTGNFGISPTEYLGFEFTPMGGSLDYGFATLAVDLPDGSVNIESFTYDDSGAAVTIPGSAAPEPGSFALLAAGAAGIAALRARRKAVR